MKKENLLFYLFLILGLTISCTSDDEELELENSIVSICSEDWVDNGNNSSHCIYGEGQVSPGETQTYGFESSNASNNNVVIWEVEGAIIIEQVINTTDNGWKVSLGTLKFNSDFNGGLVRAKESSAIAELGLILKN